ncbi:MAG TPA: glycosyltransferase family 9 protein [Vicinamibacteria bacterium]|nr:glycosyltransferase family 9 protein [Vicinamibacteria bacterium]
MLLRTAVATLRAAGHRVSLLAPAAAGAALLGSGPAEVEAVLPWEAAPVAHLLSGGDALSPEMERALSPFDAVVAYTGNPALARALGLGGARVVVHPPRPPCPGPHVARFMAEAVTTLGADAAIEPPLLVASPEEDAQARRWVDRLPSGFLAVHPGSGSPRKNWPAERFAEMVEVLAAGRPWLLVEGPADAEAARVLALRPRAVIARELPARILGALLAQAGLYVGNDSGVSHLAAAFGAPSLVVFGPTDPAQWAPVGRSVLTLRASDHTLEGIAVETVTRMAREALSSPRPPSG